MIFVEVLGPATSDPRSGNRRIMCRCVCGKEWAVRLVDFNRGRIKSCGCKKYEITAEFNTTHGHSASGSNSKNGNRRVSKEYDAWQHMLDRCNNPKSEWYHEYGGRGIKVCDEWTQSFTNFLNDIGLAPSGTHSIDRKDVNGDYTKDNCRWATYREQNRNKRNNRALTFNNRTLLVIEWAELLGCKPCTLYMRLHRKWSVERTLTTPIR